MVQVITFEPFEVVSAAHGSLWFHDSGLFPDVNSIEEYEDPADGLMLTVKAHVMQALRDSQPEGGCDLLGMNPVGDVANVRFGVFTTETPAPSSLFGSFYLGRILEDGDDYDARFMPSFPQLSNMEIADLTIEIVEHMLTNTLQTDVGPLNFVKFCYNFATVNRDWRDVRTQIMHAQMIAYASGPPWNPIKKIIENINVDGVPCLHVTIYPGG